MVQPCRYSVRSSGWSTYREGRSADRFSGTWSRDFHSSNSQHKNSNEDGAIPRDTGYTAPAETWTGGLIFGIDDEEGNGGRWSRRRKKKPTEKPRWGGSSQWEPAAAPRFSRGGARPGTQARPVAPAASVAGAPDQPRCKTLTGRSPPGLPRVETSSHGPVPALRNQNPHRAPLSSPAGPIVPLLLHFLLVLLCCCVCLPRVLRSFSRSFVSPLLAVAP